MASDEEIMLTFVDKLINEIITPTIVLEQIFKQAVKSNHIRVVEKFLKSKLINTKFISDNIGDVLYCNFSQTRNYDMVYLFLSDPEIKLGVCLNNIFYVACYEGSLENTKKLLDYVDPSENNDRSLNNAAMCGHIEIVKLLLADNRINFKNNTIAITRAFNNKHIEIVKLLIPLVDLSKIDIAEIHEIAKEIIPKPISLNMITELSEFMKKHNLQSVFVESGKEIKIVYNS